MWKSQWSIEKGLVDAGSSEQFDEELEQLRERWDNLQLCCLLGFIRGLRISKL